MTNQPLWDEKKEADFREKHFKKYGVWPQEVKFKEVNMTSSIPVEGTDKSVTKINYEPGSTEEIKDKSVTKIDHFMGGLTLTEEQLKEHAFNLPPKRTRRAKGMATGTSKTIKISGDGHLTVTLTGVSLLELSKVDRDFVFGILDMLDRVTNG